MPPVVGRRRIGVVWLRHDPLFWTWTLLVLALLAPRLTAALGLAFHELATSPWRPRWPLAGANLLTSLTVASVAVALIGILWLTGLHLTRSLLRRSVMPEAIRIPASLLAGIGAASTVLMGWLLLRLWFPPVLLFTLLSLAAIAATRLRDVSRHVSVTPVTNILSSRWVIFVLALWLPWMFVPETEMNAWEYHLAAPQRWLDLHGLALAHADMAHHFPLLAELVDVWPLWAGLDAVPRWISVAAALAGVAALASLLRPDSTPLALILFATSSSTGAFLTAKSDGFNTGAVLATAAIACSRHSSSVVAGLFAGMALSSKTTAPLNLAWIPLTVMAMWPGRRFRWLAGFAAGSITAWLPWLVKSYVLTGNPVYPILEAGPMVRGFSGRPIEALLSGTIGEHAAITWVLPLVLWAGLASELPALPPLVATLLWCVLFPNQHTARWAFPAASAAGLLILNSRAAREMATSTAVRGVFVVLVGAATLLRFATTFGSSGLAGNPFPFLLGAESGREHVSRGLTTFEDAREFLLRQPGKGATLLVAEHLQYGMPQPCYPMAIDDRQAPVGIYEMVQASRTPEEIRKRFKQLNAHWLVYNPVRALNAAHAQEPLPWSRDQLGLWQGFFGHWTDVAYVPERMNYRQGTDFVYRIRSSPLPHPPRLLLHLPGTETVFRRALILNEADFHAEAVEEAIKALRLVPGVAVYMNTAAEIAFRAGRRKEALDWFRPSLRAGFLQGENYFLGGLCAYELGLKREAVAWLEKAAIVNPHRRDQALMVIARCQRD